MALSNDTVRRLMIALASKPAGNEVASAMNNAINQNAQSAWSMAAVIVATSVSTTVDFAALKVGDKLVHIPAAAGNSAFESVATAGTKPSAAVIGDLYIALRAVSNPSASSSTL